MVYYRNTDVLHSDIARLEEYTYSYAKGTSLGAKVVAKSSTTNNLTSTTIIRNTTVIGHDLAELYASTKPAYRKANVDSYARIQLNAIGEGDAYSHVDGSANATLDIGLALENNNPAQESPNDNGLP